MKVMLPNNLSLDTKAVANIYMLSVVYDFAKVGELTPYFVAGIGLGDIRIKGGSVNSGDLKVFELNKAHRTALAFQLGIGGHYPLNDFIALDVATKIQGITNVKMKYKKFDTVTGQLKNKSTKQHLGVAELVAGFVFKF